jgi:hypothetical protein
VQLSEERPVVDRGRVHRTGSDQFLCRVWVSQPVSGDSHEPVEAAEQEVQVGLLARPQPPVQQPVDPSANPAHVQEHGKRLTDVGLVRKPYQVSTELVESDVSDSMVFRLLGVITTLMGHHENLSLNREPAQIGLWYPTVSDGERYRRAGADHIRGDGDRRRWRRGCG